MRTSDHANGPLHYSHCPSSSSSEHHPHRRQSSNGSESRISRLDQSQSPDVYDETQRPRRNALLDRQSSSATYLHSNCAAASADVFSAEAGNPSQSDPSLAEYYHQSNHVPLHLTKIINNSNSNNNINTEEEDNLYYYRIIYKGVVALLESPDPKSKRTGSYLSYGEIFGSRRNRQMEWNTALPVDLLLSGGYAVDASTCLLDPVDQCGPTPKRSNNSTLSNPTFSGFCFIEQNGSRLVELLRTKPHVEMGPFHYKVTSSAPLPILTGPCADAPRTKAVVLPGTVEEISLRLGIDCSPRDSDDKILWFLRLSHRRGWIADRLVRNHSTSPIRPDPSMKQSLHQHLQTIHVVQEILPPTAAALATIASDMYSMDGGSSVWSGTTGATSCSAGAHSKRRHKPPRRQREAASDLPRHVSKQLQQQQQQQQIIHPPPQQQNDSSSSFMAPSSNVSVLSDDSSVLDHPSQHRFGNIQNNNSFNSGNCSRPHQILPSSPNTSFNTNRSVGSASHFQQPPKQQHAAIPLTPPPPISFFLMRVTAPRGLKILDAPQFQVNNLIARSKRHQQHTTFSSHAVSQIESPSKNPHHSIFQTMSGRLVTTGPSQRHSSGSNTVTPAVLDANSQTRRLPRGALFEASTRMTPASVHEGSGLIKLSDNSGWAIVPTQADLDQQYRQGGGIATRTVEDGEATQAYKEVGSAVIKTAPASRSSSFDQAHMDDCSSTFGLTSTTWLRVLARAGVSVVCPPPTSDTDTDTLTSPTSSRGSSVHTGSNHGSFLPHGNESDVASSVGSGFLDAMFRAANHHTPSKKKPADSDDGRGNGRQQLQQRQPLSTSSTIPCGMFVEVEPWAGPPPSKISSLSNESSSRNFARLRGGQGWLPLLTTDDPSQRYPQQHQLSKPVAARAAPPQFRYGSFWFRVCQQRGVRVRLGPSRRAPSIKSDDGVHFRFECGEFLRASEIVTVFADVYDQGVVSRGGEPIESFVKLYRNRHVRLRELNNDEEEEYRSLTVLTMQAEWVQVYSDSELYLEECATEPRIERHKQGWRYNVVPDDGIAVRKGPSFAAEKTGIILFGGESVVVTERVTPSGEKITWLRMKDGQGWIHDVDAEGNTIMIAHSLRHRAQHSNRQRKSATPQEENPIVYNTINQRLFRNEDGGGKSTGNSYPRNTSCASLT